MVTWTELPLELRHQVLAHILPPVDTQAAGSSFVGSVEPFLLVNKAFGKAMRYPLEQYVCDFEIYRDKVLEKDSNAKELERETL